MKHGTRIILQLFAVLLYLCLTGCVDKSYDFSNVDFTIGTHVDLWLPNCSVDSIKLRNLFDLEEDGILRDIDGTYYLVESGEADITPIDAEEIHMEKPDIESFSTTLDLTTVRPNVGKGSDKADGKNVVYYPLGKMAHYEILPTSEEVSEDIIDVTRVECKPVSIVFHVNIPEFPKFVNTVHVDNLIFYVPTGIHITSCIFDGRELLGTPELIAKAQNEGIIQAIDGEDSGRAVNEVVSISFTLDEAVIGPGNLAVFEDRMVQLSGTIRADGYFRITEEEINHALLTASQQASLDKNDLSSIMPSGVELTGTGEFDGDVVVTSFDGVVQHEVGQVAPIKLDDLPEFMEEPGNNISLDNPVIFVEVDNPMPAELTTGVTLISKYSDGQQTNKQTGKISIPANQHTVLYLANRDEGICFPEEYKNLPHLYVHVDNLKDLLTRIPREVEVKVDDMQANCVNFLLGKQYPVDVKYRIYTPITFDEDFCMTYRGTEDGWAEDMSEDLKNVDVKEIAAKAIAVSDIPMDFNIQITPIDTEGRAISGLEIQQPATVQANSKGTPVEFRIKPAQGHTIQEYLSGDNGQQLDGIRYVIKVDANSTGTLQTEAHLRLEKLRVGVIGGITYDAN